MEHELRILCLEDSPQDAEFVRRELQRAGMAFTLRCVETREDFVEQREFSAEPDYLRLPPAVV